MTDIPSTAALSSEQMEMLSAANRERADLIVQYCSRHNLALGSSAEDILAYLNQSHSPVGFDEFVLVAPWLFPEGMMPPALAEKLNGIEPDAPVGDDLQLEAANYLPFLRSGYLLIALSEKGKKGHKYDPHAPARRLAREMVLVARKHGARVNLALPREWQTFANRDVVIQTIAPPAHTDVLDDVRRVLARGQNYGRELGSSDDDSRESDLRYLRNRDESNLGILTNLFKHHPDPVALAEEVLDTKKLNDLLDK